MNWADLKRQASALIVESLGEKIRYQYKDGGISEFCAIFTIVDVQLTDGEVSVDSRKPAVSIRMCDVSRKPRQGDKIIRRDVVYEIQQCEEDHDTGWRCLLMVVDYSANLSKLAKL